MAQINTTSPAGFVTAVLIADEVTTPGAGSDSIQTGLTTPSTALELRSTLGALVVSRMTAAQVAAMTPTNGMVVYDTTATAFRFYQNGAFVNLSAGAGGVTGPGLSTNTAVALWNGAGGNVLMNSVVLIDAGGDITGALTIQNGAGALALPSYTFTGNTAAGMWSSAANTVDFSTNAFRVLQLVASPALSVNYLSLTASATGNPLLLTAAGTDANIGVRVIPKGTGSLQNSVGAIATPSYSFVGRLTNGMWSSGANTIDFSTNALEALRIAASPAAAVNFVTITSAATGNNANISMANSGDANASLQIIGNGTGGLIVPVGAVATPSVSFAARTDTGMWSSAAATIDFSTTGGRQAQIANVAAAVNWISITGGATVAAGAGPGQPVLTALGTDTIVDVAVASKGAATGLALRPNTAAGAGALRFWNGAGTQWNLYQGAAYAGNATYTLPAAVPATDGLVLTSTAAGVMSWGAPPATSSVTVAQGSIAAAAFQGMYAAPVQLIAAPAAGFGIIVLSAYLELVFTTAAPAAGGVIIFQYANTVHGAGTNVITNAAAATIPAAFATGAAASQFQVLASLNQGTTAGAGITALGVFLSNQTQPFTANGGTSSLNYGVTYMVVPMV